MGRTIFLCKESVNNKKTCLSKCTYKVKSHGVSICSHSDAQFCDHSKNTELIEGDAIVYHGDDGVRYAKYEESGSGDFITKDGHTMFISDVVRDLNRKSYLEKKIKDIQTEYKSITKIDIPSQCIACNRHIKCHKSIKRRSVDCYDSILVDIAREFKLLDDIISKMD